MGNVLYAAGTIPKLKSWLWIIAIEQGTLERSCVTFAIVCSGYMKPVGTNLKFTLNSGVIKWTF